MSVEERATQRAKQAAERQCCVQKNNASISVEERAAQKAKHAAGMQSYCQNKKKKNCEEDEKKLQHRVATERRTILIT